MADFINTVISVILGFVILVGGSLVIMTVTLDSETKRTVANEVDNFIDKVEDTGVITKDDLADLYVNTSVNGVTMDVKVSREVLTLYPTGPVGDTKVIYVKSEDINTFNKGDRVVVQVEAIDYSAAQRLVWMILNLYTDKIKYGNSGVVEQAGGL